MKDNKDDLKLIDELKKRLDELKKEAIELPKRRLEKPDFGDFVKCESCSSWEQCSPCDMCIEEGYAAVGKDGETIILKKYEEGEDA